MADVKLIDIDGVQWNLKDQEARNRLVKLENGVEIRDVLKSKGNDLNIKLIKIFDVELLQIRFAGYPVIIADGYPITSFQSDFEIKEDFVFMASCDRNDNGGRVPSQTLVTKKGGIFLYPSTDDNWKPNFGAGKVFGTGLFEIN